MDANKYLFTEFISHNINKYLDAMNSKLCKVISLLFSISWKQMSRNIISSLHFWSCSLATEKGKKCRICWHFWGRHKTSPAHICKFSMKPQLWPRSSPRPAEISATINKITDERGRNGKFQYLNYSSWFSVAELCIMNEKCSIVFFSISLFNTLILSFNVVKFT